MTVMLEDDQTSASPKKRKIVGKVLLVLVLALAMAYVLCFVPLFPHDLAREGLTTLEGGVFDYTLPLDSRSPWPKFRADAMQTGRTPLIPRETEGLLPWRVNTGKGIFSSPVVGEDGTVYIGSGNHSFYAIDVAGNILWKLETGEIIDSSALLAEDGRLYFGSGDGHVYAVGRETGKVAWTYRAQTPQEVEAEYNIKTYNVGWFEGNIGMLPDGSLLAPNDNYLVYRLNRGTGGKQAAYLGNEMVWTCPAVNMETGRLFFGTCAQVMQNVFAYDFDGKQSSWVRGGLGTVSSSPMLTSNRANGAVIIGCFDGYLRALSQHDGKTLWQTALGDHIYASAASLGDGTIIQPAADGTVYALDPTNGRVLWTFDTLEPIRSSPAVDGLDNIYVGSGEGKLFCLNGDGSLKWSYQLIEGLRNDLNASPALGYDGVYIAGESGEIFFVPYGYPLSVAGRADPRTFVGGETLPEEGVFLYALSGFGALTENSPAEIDANQPIGYELFVRKAGATLPSQLDRGSINITIDPATEVVFTPAANGRFFVLTPKERWPEGGFTVTMNAKAKTDFFRLGLKAMGGKDAGSVEKQERFKVRPLASQDFPIILPSQGDATVFELKRLAVPNPVMLPSYNQIGFDSLHYLAGAVCPAEDQTLFWVVGGKLQDEKTVYDPSIQARFPLLLKRQGSLLTFQNQDGFKINFIGSWDMPFKQYRISTDGAGLAQGETSCAVLASMACDEIEYYGLGLKLMGMSDFATGMMHAYGGMNLAVYPGAKSVEGVGKVSFALEGNRLTATLEESALPVDAHVYSILLTTEDGLPLPLYYTKDTAVQASHGGQVSSVSLSWEKGQGPQGEVTAYFIIDNYVAAQEKIKVE